jgi:micrococcal nuclease
MYEYQAIARQAYDGDTIRLDIDLGFGIWRHNEPIRLLGIDAPELGTPLGPAARDYLRDKLPIGAPLVIQTAKDKSDKYGRLLGVIWPGTAPIGASVNELLIHAGHARPYTGGPRT